MAGKMESFVSLDSVYVRCPCMASITGKGEPVQRFYDEHRAHCDGTLHQVITDDGMRVLPPDTPRRQEVPIPGRGVPPTSHKVILNDLSNGYVGTATVPDPLPGVLAWRGRVFVLTVALVNVGGLRVYAEGLLGVLGDDVVDQGPVR